MRKISHLQLLLFLLLGLNTFGQKTKKLYTFPIGAQAYTFRNSFPNGITATLDTIKALGITELEGNVPKGMDATEYLKLLKERNIKVPSTGAGYEEIVANPMSVVENAKKLGAKFVMVAWIPHKADFDIFEAQQAVEDFDKVGKVLAENGITFCYHIHGYEFIPYQDGTLFDFIARRTNPKYVSFELDMLWAFHGGANPEGLLDKYPTRFKMLHVKDLRKGVQGNHSGSTPVTNDVTLGTGQIDVAGIIRKAKKLGIKHYFIEDESPIQNIQVPQSIAYLKSLKE
ncbi:TIM barrel protein [Emticicia sp. ODNR4P]|nr:TIM barrel protein [Emticicia sp. ODNR4P]